MDPVILLLAGLAAAFGLLSVILLIMLLRKQKKDDRAVTDRLLREELAAQNQLLENKFNALRRDTENSLANSNQRTETRIAELTVTMDRRLEAVRQATAESLDRHAARNNEAIANMTGVIDRRILSLQEDNAQKLEKMRETVDEKLTGTLEKRLGESFRTVSEQLGKVSEGLGEMRALADGVGDLKKVLTNVKTRGTWGEVSLGSLLEQLLSPQQYRANVKIRPRSQELVEYAICLPGKEEGLDTVYLPIDSKFPLENYIRLVETSEGNDPVQFEAASRQLEADIRHAAMDIRDKYIDPPRSTDFAIMYLPTEGLYAEVTRRAELCARLQREMRVTVMGPTTLGAFLNSLQMGFRTLAIQKRSGEVWKLLGAVKKSFGTFGEVLEATQKKLEEASGKLGDARKRTEQIRRRLDAVEELPTEEAEALLAGNGSVIAGTFGEETL